VCCRFKVWHVSEKSRIENFYAELAKAEAAEAASQ
jgi:hypothetical protein